MRKLRSRFRLPTPSSTPQPQPPSQTQSLTPAAPASETDEKIKPLLYLAYYARPKRPGSYHLALHVCFSTTSPCAVKYHCKNILQKVEVVIIDDSAASGTVTANRNSKSTAQEIWTFERKDIDAQKDYWLLARVLLGHLTLPSIPETPTIPPDFDALMCSIPVTVQPADDPAFNCVEWVRRALEAVRGEGLLEGVRGLEWAELDGRGRRWVGRMVESGRAGGAEGVVSCGLEDLGEGA